MTTSIVVALAGKDAIPLILGANIGTCVTALIASINTRLSARRTAIAHLFFNIPFLSLFTRLVSLTSSHTARQE
ncbi:MAG: Na/Pi symporter [Dictyoglomus sp.]|nr:Na/Pi symporter [Dictyoglomus sp.]MDW8189102.1 Na/Pi symporter [Dictyoglomus sp.]